MSFVQEIKALESFMMAPRALRTLVFYSEGPEYWPYFRGIIDALLRRHHCRIDYVSSSARDPGLDLRHPLVRTYNIGHKGARVNFFEDLSADICVLTMPDLARLTLKKSKSCRNYVYLFHSPVSTHMIYNEGAFDHYDTIFTVGKHQEAEIRKREEMLADPPKRLFAHGYGRLDDIISHATPEISTHAGARDEPASVLIAPSWGTTGLFETVGDDLVKALLDAGMRVVARPHPQTLRLSQNKIAALRENYAAHTNFYFEDNMASRNSFYTSDVIISDWSGAALDFAFARLRPVLFIDTPRKVNNPNFGDIGVDPLECSIRDRVGVILAPENMNMAAQTVRDLIERAPEFEAAIREERTQWIHNLGRSADVAAGELARLALNASLEDDGALADLEGRCMAAAAELAADCKTGEPGNEVSIVDIVMGMMAVDTEFNSEQLSQLDALARRIDVFKKLHNVYDPEIARPGGDKSLAPREIYPALACAFIRSARELAQHNRGLALKFLNAAGNTIDCYQALDGVRGGVAIESMLMHAYNEIEGAP